MKPGKFHTPPQAVLRQQWDNLNAARIKRALQPYNYRFLAEVAGSEEAIPGDPIHISKPTVAAVMAGTYHTKTEPVIRRRLAQIIAIKCADMGINVEPAPHQPKPRTPVIRFIRCSNEGYLEYRGHTYYLGSVFAGQACTVLAMRDGKSKGVKVASTGLSRIAYPVDATNNQFGYQAASK